MRVGNARLIALGLGLVGFLIQMSPRAQAGDVLTQHYNNNRTGAVLDESILNTTNVGSARFQKLWELYADGQVVAQPLFISNLSIDTTSNHTAPVVKGTFNAVIIATMHNTVYVYDADKENRGPDGRTVPLWATWLGPPQNFGDGLPVNFLLLAQRRHTRRLSPQPRHSRQRVPNQRHALVPSGETLGERIYRAITECGS
jgi:hypothetical protein